MTSNTFQEEEKKEVKKKRHCVRILQLMLSGWSNKVRYPANCSIEMPGS